LLLFLLSVLIEFVPSIPVLLFLLEFWAGSIP